jgi:putative heme degradation protein
MSIAVIPTQANRIRALKEAEPSLTARQIAVRLGVDPQIVDIALGRGDTPRG